MALCGTTKKMLNGLRAFNEDLIQHGLIHRSEKNGETIDQAIKREVSDITRLLQETHRIDDAAKRLVTEGILTYVLGFYLAIQRDPKWYNEVLLNTEKYFTEMDKKYYSELDGKSNDMKQLAEFLNELPI